MRPGLSLVQPVRSAAIQTEHYQKADPRQRMLRQRVAVAAGSLPDIRNQRFGRLAAGEPRILSLVQFCQIRQAIYRQLLSIALASRRETFNISANFLP